jgi:hypothetical protein
VVAGPLVLRGLRENFLPKFGLCVRDELWFAGRSFSYCRGHATTARPVPLPVQLIEFLFSIYSAKRGLLPVDLLAARY